jgi:hypothetical protein
MNCHRSPRHPLFALPVGLLSLLFCLSLPGCRQPADVEDEIRIASLEELARYAVESGHVIRMEPGVYRLIDFLPLESMAARRQSGDWPFFHFSGSDNRFHLEGVTIELDTALRAALRPPIHTGEFVISGHNNEIQGLTIRCIGEGTSQGGSLLSITGEGTTLRDCTFHVQGSSPYGYGDLFGKGPEYVISHRKHSGVRIAGSNTSLYDCKLFMRSFGHGYYMQAGAKNLHFENCHVEGEMRSSDDMLAETAGPAFAADFATVIRNREGENRVLPGYMKSLAEDGYRTYGDIENLTFINCTAKNMRGGWEMRTKHPVRIENCTAIGNERGFWVSGGAKVINSRGDARHGPLLFVEGSGGEVELELLPGESDAVIHALALIHGSDHTITLRPAREGTRERPLPIKIGYGTPGAGEGMAAIPERAARNITLVNETEMPVIVGQQAVDNSVTSQGAVTRESGSP